MNNRPSWDQYFMTITQQVAERSTCTRAKVGAVIVRDKNILATGYNGAPAGMPHLRIQDAQWRNRAKLFSHHSRRDECYRPGGEEWREYQRCRHLHHSHTLHSLPEGSGQHRNQGYFLLETV